MKNSIITKTPQWKLRLRGKLNQLSAAEGKVAEWVLNNPDGIIDESIQELAEKSKVSEATVVRFCRSLGYKGLKEFKIAIAQEHVVDTGSKNLGRSLDSTDTIKAMRDKVFYGCMEALQDTMDVIDDKELARAVKALYEARYTEVFGIGGSASVARSAQHNFRKIGLRMSVSVEINHDYLMAERFNNGDAVLAISLSGETKSVLEAVRIAKRKGAVIICITNIRDSSLARISDIRLTSACQTRMMPGDETYERVAQIAIIQALYAGVAMKLRDKEEAEPDLNE